MLSKDIAIFLDDLNNNSKGTLFDILECMDIIDSDIEYFKIDIITRITETLEDNSDGDDLKEGLFLISKVCECEPSKTKYSYPEEVKKDILTYLKKYGKPFETEDTLHGIYNFYHDDEFLYNYVTGNDVGEKKDPEESEICLHGNIEIIKKALCYFNYNKDDIIKWNPCDFDVLIRCYIFENMLPLAISEHYSDDVKNM